MTRKTNAALQVIVISAVVLATPAAAVDGEILIDQARVNTGGITPGDAPGFPATLNRAGRYKLTGNLTVPADMTGIEVVTNDVTIDLNGFTISRAASGPHGAGVYALGRTRLKVMNGTISGFTDAIYNGGGTFGVIVDMRALSGVYGVYGGNDAEIRNSTIANNARGIVCSGCRIEGNVVTGNSFFGIEVHETALVVGNVIAGNGGHGLHSFAKTGYGSNILVGNNNGGAQVTGAVAQLHPNYCDPACP